MRFLYLLGLCLFLVGCNQTSTTTHSPITTTSETTLTTSTSTALTSSNEALLQSFVDNFTLPSQLAQSMTWSTLVQGIQITYQSHNPLLLENNGTIHPGLTNESVQITVSFQYQEVTQTKIYTILILARKWSDVDIIEQDLRSLSIATTIIDQDLILPKVGVNGSLIVWKSSHPHIVSPQGKYYPPVEAERITLTATLYYEGLERVKTFDFDVKPIPDETKVQMAMLMLQLPSSTQTNLILPSRGYYGVQIQYSSSHPEILSPDGTFIPPIGVVEVVLTATLTLNQVSLSQAFHIQAIGQNPQSFLAKAANQLVLNHGISVLFESVVLPTQLLQHVSVTWTSTHPDILSPTGEFHIPTTTTTVVLQARLQVLDLTMTKEFTYLVIGSTDITSDEVDQQVDSFPLDLHFPVWIEKGEALTRGRYEHVMMKEGRLVLTGDSLQGTYTSPWLTTQSFIRLNLMWSSVTHPDARTAMEVRTYDGLQTTPWISLGDWGYGGENQPPQITLNLSNPAVGIQYRIQFSRKTATIPSPRLHSVSLNVVYLTPMVDYDTTLLSNQILYPVVQLRQADTLDASLWNNICWGTSISMMLQYYNQLTHLAVPQEYYAPLIRLGTTRYGTVKNDIGASQFDMDVLEVEFHSLSMLLYALHHYGPVIVGVSKGTSPDGKFGPLTFSSGHVIVVVGYEIQTNGSVILHVNDPAVSWIREVFSGPSEEFMLVWDKGGIILQPHS